MPDRPDADVARRLYEAIAGDPVDSAPALSELLDPDVRWHVPGSNPISGTYSGREATLALFSGRGSDSTFEMLDVLTGEHFVMVFVQHRVGSGLGTRFVHILRTRAGRVAESWHFDEDQARLDRLVEEAP